MARNTGRGSIAASKAPKRFPKMKEHGGSFKPMPRSIFDRLKGWFEWKSRK